MNQIQWYDLSNETSLAELSYGTIYDAVKGGCYS